MAVDKIVIPQYAPKESALDKILKGLQLAQAGLGVAEGVDKFTDFTGKRAEGRADDQLKALASKGYIPAQPPQKEAAAPSPLIPGQEASAPSQLLPPTAPSPLKPPSPKEYKMNIPGKGEMSFVNPEKTEESSKREMDLRKEFSGYAKPVIEAANGFKKVLASEASPAGDVSLIFGYMKTIDPGSTVREGEFANVENARGIGDSIRNIYNKVMSGSKLTPAQRADFKRAATVQFKSQLDALAPIRERYGAIATKTGVDPEDVTDLGLGSYDKQLEEQLKVKPKAVSYDKMTDAQLDAALKKKGLVK